MHIFFVCWRLISDTFPVLMYPSISHIYSQKYDSEMILISQSSLLSRYETRIMGTIYL